MAFLTCPQCGRLTSTGRTHCIECDVRLPQDFGILLQPNPQADLDSMLRTTLLRFGSQAAVRQWLEINPNGGLDNATACIKRLKAALSPKQRPPAE